MTRSNVSFVAKVVALSGALSAAIKYAVPLLLIGSPAGQNSPTMALVVGLLLAPSVLMSALFWLRRSAHS